MRGRKIMRRFITPGVVIGALVLGGGLFIVSYYLINWSRPPRTPAGVVTAALTVIPAPTSTQQSFTPTPEEPTPNPEEPPPPPAGELTIGAFVKISGTEGAGLRLRINPGLDHEPLYLGLESEVFEIEDGPQEADGYVWWYLVAPFDPSRSGWAVSNYLEVIQEP